MYVCMYVHVAVRRLYLRAKRLRRALGGRSAGQRPGVQIYVER